MLLVAGIVACTATRAQDSPKTEEKAPFGPNELAVIVNADDPLSVKIGDYYQKSRRIPDENIIKMGLRELVWVIFDHFQSTGNMHVSILSRRYSSSRRPYARRWMTRILLFSPSTKPSETLFSGLQ